jgi:hypothetical protein
MKKYLNKFWSWLDSLMKPAPVIKKRGRPRKKK